MKAPYYNSFEASKMRAYIERKKRGKGVSMVRDIASQFPFKDLQRMAVGSQGGPDIAWRAFPDPELHKFERWEA
jgi:hypothetical protein